MKDAGRRVLVTGATGFIGGNLCPRLLELSTDVHAVSRTEPTAPDVIWHPLDVTDRDALQAVVRTVAPDLVYHLASHVTGSTASSEIDATLDANLVSSVAVFQAAAECGARVVTAGSYTELGVGLGAPGSPYAAAKSAATVYAQMFHQVFGVSIVNLRLYMVYGPGQRDLTKLVPYTITSLLTGAAPELTSGERVFDWVYIDDVIDAFVAAGRTGTGDNGTPIAIGTGKLTSIREIVGRITAAIGESIAPRFGARPDRPPEPQHRATLERAEAVLGWRPRTEIATGIPATVEWYRANLAVAAGGPREVHPG